MSEEPKAASRVREEMERLLDYEIRGSILYPLFDALGFCGFENWLGWWFGKKVNRKYARYLRRPSEMEAIIEERGPYYGFRK